MRNQLLTSASLQKPRLMQADVPCSAPPALPCPGTPAASPKLTPASLAAPPFCLLLPPHPAPPPCLLPAPLPYPTPPTSSRPLHSARTAPLQTPWSQTRETSRRGLRPCRGCFGVDARVWMRGQWWVGCRPALPKWHARWTYAA